MYVSESCIIFILRFVYLGTLPCTPCIYRAVESPSIKPLASTVTLALSDFEIYSGLSGHLGKYRASLE